MERKKNIKAHKRYDPRLNKKVDVGSYDRNQRYKQYKNLSKKSKPIEKYRCYYGGESVSIGELIRTDQILANMDGEEREFLMDSLPKSNNPRKAPYVHKSNLGYDVLNLCSKDLQGFDSDLEFDTLISEKDALYKKLFWVDKMIDYKTSKIRKFEKNNPLKVESLEEEIRELTEDQETLGESISNIDEKVESLKDEDKIEW